MTIGNRIAVLRREHGYSQEHVAEQLGVSRQAVSKWETDQSSPDTNNLIALAALLGTTVEYLAVGKREETPPMPVAPQNTLTVRKVIGLILVGVGSLALVLGVLLSPILLMLAAYFLITGILCLTLHRCFGLVLGWTLYVVTLLPISMTTGVRLGVVFLGAFWREFLGVRIASAFVLVMWAALIVLVTITIARILRAIRKRRKDQLP
ncbi:MAG: helix-turn-helix transcriptional regulator [Clostridia bacterium]|nr:helix-turn-helix transcriptional regulator [Clostridia bacterium]